MAETYHQVRRKVKLSLVSYNYLFYMFKKYWMKRYILLIANVIIFIYFGILIWDTISFITDPESYRYTLNYTENMTEISESKQYRNYILGNLLFFFFLLLLFMINTIGLKGGLNKSFLKFYIWFIALLIVCIVMSYFFVFK